MADFKIGGGKVGANKIGIAGGGLSPLADAEEASWFIGFRANAAIAIGAAVTAQAVQNQFFHQQQPEVVAQPTSLGDPGDHWLGGVENCFVGIAIFLGAAVTAQAVRAQNQFFHQQQPEVVAQTTSGGTTGVGSYAQTAAGKTTIFQWGGTDAYVPPPTAAALDDGAAQIPADPVRDPPAGAYEWGASEGFVAPATTAALEQVWQPPDPPPRDDATILVSADGGGESIPGAPPDEFGWQPGPTIPDLPDSRVWNDQPERVAAAATIVEDLGGQIEQPPVAATGAAFEQRHEDQPVPAAPAAGYEDWQDPRSGNDQPPPDLTLWSEQGELGRPALEDAGWQDYTQPPPLAVAFATQEQGEIGSPATAALDDGGWQPDQHAPRPAVVFVAQDQGEVSNSLAYEETSEGPAIVPRAAAAEWRQDHQDDFPQQAAATIANVDEPPPPATAIAAPSLDVHQDSGDFVGSTAAEEQSLPPQQAAIAAPAFLPDAQDGDFVAPKLEETHQALPPTPPAVVFVQVDFGAGDDFAPRAVVCDEYEQRPEWVPPPLVAVWWDQGDERVVPPPLVITFDEIYWPEPQAPLVPADSTVFNDNEGAPELFAPAPTPAPTPAPAIGGGDDDYRYSGAIRHGGPTRKPTAAPTPQPTRDPFMTMLMKEDDDLVKWVREMYSRGDFEPRKE